MIRMNICMIRFPKELRLGWNFSSIFWKLFGATFMWRGRLKMYFQNMCSTSKINFLAECKVQLIPPGYTNNRTSKYEWMNYFWTNAWLYKSTNQLINFVLLKKIKSFSGVMKRASSTTSTCIYWLNYWHTLKSKDTSGFTSNTLLIRFSIMLSVYIVYSKWKTFLGFLICLVNFNFL